MSECPKCKSEIGKASYCGCGWKKRSWKSGEGEKYVDPFPLQCSWVSGGERCNYPGTHSHSTTGSSTWFCSAHLNCTNPVSGAEIVDSSRKYRPVNSLVKLEREMNELAERQRLIHHLPKGKRFWAQRLKVLIDAGHVKPTPTMTQMMDAVLQVPIRPEEPEEIELKKVELEYS